MGRAPESHPPRGLLGDFDLAEEAAEIAVGGLQALCEQAPGRASREGEGALV
jgi:hypothetical protein